MVDHGGGGGGGVSPLPGAAVTADSGCCLISRGFEYGFLVKCLS